MTVEETLRAMLDGWTEDKWVKGKGLDGDRVCVLNHARVVGGREQLLAVKAVMDETVQSHWPARNAGFRGFRGPANVTDFNDHPDTTFADVVALVEKAAAYAAEQGL